MSRRDCFAKLAAKEKWPHVKPTRELLAVFGRAMSSEHHQLVAKFRREFRFSTQHDTCLRMLRTTPHARVFFRNMALLHKWKKFTFHKTRTGGLVVRIQHRLTSAARVGWQDVQRFCRRTHLTFDFDISFYETVITLEAATQSALP